MRKSTFPVNINSILHNSRKVTPSHRAAVIKIQAIDVGRKYQRELRAWKKSSEGIAGEPMPAGLERLASDVKILELSHRGALISAEAMNMFPPLL